jgi:hypothetical protein
MTDDQLSHLSDQLAQISRQATPTPVAAAFTLMLAAIQLNRTYGLPDDLTKQMFADVVDGSGDGADNDAPVRLVN